MDILQSWEASKSILHLLLSPIKVKYYFFRIDGEEDTYDARLYKVKNDWKVEVRVDDEGYNTQVVRIHDDDSESEEVLVSKDVKRYKLKYKGISAKDVREGVEIANGIADLIGKIFGWFKPFSMN